MSEQGGAMNIDWSKAPDWAIGHGLVVQGAIKQVWYGEQAYMIVGDNRSYVYGGGDGETRHNHMPNAIQFKTLRPAVWNGEGLPPAGAVCEFTSNDGRNWRETSILFRDDHAALLAGYELFKVTDPDVRFRQIRTVEQIAAEKYERDAEELAEVMKIYEPIDPLALAKLVLDCGYSKQVRP